ncbi:ribonuclease P protein subunit p21 [Halichoeres trimaculatus]|uniref:ribonuclease P protein subunit p21 n=1 Tax=Halichoeres trimaculatus TaxID=147232 RepID=UPI003D9F58CA
MEEHINKREAYQRMNYLYQAAHCVLAQNPENVELARFYCLTQKTISRRLVIRQDPSVKRTICKRCSSLLIPGVTATTRQRKKNRRTRFTVQRCLSCGQSKSLLNNPDYTLWIDRPEAQLEMQPDQGCSGVKWQKKKKPQPAGSKKEKQKQKEQERQEEEQQKKLQEEKQELQRKTQQEEEEKKKQKQ